MDLFQLLKPICGNGIGIRFWLDNWIGNVILKDRFPLLFKLEKAKKCSVKDRFDSVAGSFTGNWCWYRTPCNNEELEEWKNLFQLLVGTVLNQTEDKRVWAGANHDTMTVKAVKDFIKSSTDYSNRYILPWSSWIPKKINIFMWRLVMDRIPTVDVLKARNCNIVNDGCVLCEDGLDSVEHLFCCCGVATLICVSSWCKATPFFMFEVKDLVELHDHVGVGKEERKALKGIIMVACWVIWKTRNERRFSNGEVNVGRMCHDIKSLSFLWYSNRKKNVSISWNDWCIFSLM